MKRNMLDRLNNAPSDEVAVKLAEQARKLIETKLRYSGADETDEKQAATPIIMIPAEQSDD
jgi:hypothetical protein